MAFNELNEFMGLNWLNQFQFSKDSQRSMDSDIFDAMFLPFGHLSDLSKHRRNSFKRSRCTSKTWPSPSPVGAQSACIHEL